VFNLSALAVLSRIGEHVDVDLWNYKTRDGRSIRQGLDFLLPYLLREKKWPDEQINEVEVSPTDMGLFYLAAVHYHDPRYLKVLDQNHRKSEDSKYAKLIFSAE